MIPILLYYSTHKCISISYGDYRLWFFNSVISYAHACFSDIKIFFFLKTHAIEKKSKEHTIHRIFGRKILQRIWRNVRKTWTVFIKICDIQNVQNLLNIMHTLFLRLRKTLVIIFSIIIVVQFFLAKSYCTVSALKY